MPQSNLFKKPKHGEDINETFLNEMEKMYQVYTKPWTSLLVKWCHIIKKEYFRNVESKDLQIVELEKKKLVNKGENNMARGATWVKTRTEDEIKFK